MPKRLELGVVKEWLALTEGVFEVRQMWAELGIVSSEGKNHLRVILYRLEHQEPPVIVNLGYGKYRKLDNEAPEISWQTANPERIVPLKFPFGEHELCRIYPKSIVIVAGSINAGKTCYLYNFIALNMLNFQVDLYNSETGPEQMNERLTPLNIPNPAPFMVYERYDHFADVIKPDAISVIDYLDINSEFYLVGAEIDAIFRKLKTGVAVIGLQKPPPTPVMVRGVRKLIDRDLAYGGGVTAKRAALYITMSSNRLKLYKVKTPMKKTVNPTNMTWTYSFTDDGAYFTNIQQYYGEDM